MILNLKQWDIILVTYNSATELQEIWAKQPSALRERVICVDNSSVDDSLAIANDLFPIAVSHENLGLSVSNNYGASLGASDNILFINPDVDMLAADLETLTTALNQHGGIVVPRLLSADNSAQANVRNWPFLIPKMMNQLGMSNRWVERYNWPIVLGRSGHIPWALGAAIAMKRTQFIRTNWPENYFLYFEDVQLCLDVWAQKSTVTLDDDVRWLHHWQAESRTNFRAAHRHLLSAVQFYAKNPGFILGTGRTVRSYKREIEK